MEWVDLNRGYSVAQQQILSLKFSPYSLINALSKLLAIFGFETEIFPGQIDREFYVFSPSPLTQGVGCPLNTAFHMQNYTMQSIIDSNTQFDPG